jgi:nucleoside-diphosphate-sugar epimerase
MAAVGPTRLCILGATGFVGRALVARIAARPGGSMEATALVRGDGARLPVRAGVRAVTGDLAGPLSNTFFFDAPYVVVHLATKQRDGDEDDDGFGVNVRYAERLLGSLTPHCRGIIYGSSASVYGQGAQLGVDETAPEAPGTLLAESRLATEWALRRGADARGVPLTVLRPRFVVGEGDRYFLPGIGRLLARRLGVGDGRQAFTIIDVADYAEAILRLADGVLGRGQTWPGVLNVGYSRPLRFSELASALGARPRWAVPVWAPALAILRRCGGRLGRLATRLELVGHSHRLEVAAFRRAVGADLVDRDPLAVIEALAHGG